MQYSAERIKDQTEQDLRRIDNGEFLSGKNKSFDDSKSDFMNWQRMHGIHYCTSCESIVYGDNCIEEKHIVIRNISYETYRQRHF